jgi:hypothetical protein
MRKRRALPLFLYPQLPQSQEDRRPHTAQAKH